MEPTVLTIALIEPTPIETRMNATLQQENEVFESTRLTQNIIKIMKEVCELTMNLFKLIFLCLTQCFFYHLKIGVC